MNCNCRLYLDEPMELLFYAIHECIHVIYERHHRIRPLNDISSPPEWRSCFNLWLQNEGFAVYAPLKLRRELGFCSERDYRVLFDPVQFQEQRVHFFRAMKKLSHAPDLSREEYLEICFGPERFTYRMGCALIQEIENRHGIEGVREAFFLDGDRFWENYKNLL